MCNRRLFGVCWLREVSQGPPELDDEESLLAVVSAGGPERSRACRPTSVLYESDLRRRFEHDWPPLGHNSARADVAKHSHVLIGLGNGVHMSEMSECG